MVLPFFDKRSLFEDESVVGDLNAIDWNRALGDEFTGFGFTASETTRDENIDNRGAAIEGGEVGGKFGNIVGGEGGKIGRKEGGSEVFDSAACLGYALQWWHLWQGPFGRYGALVV